MKRESPGEAGHVSRRSGDKYRGNWISATHRLQRVGQWRAGNPYHALEREVQFRRHADRATDPGGAEEKGAGGSSEEAGHRPQYRRSRRYWGRPVASRTVDRDRLPSC